MIEIELFDLDGRLYARTCVRPLEHIEAAPAPHDTTPEDDEP